MKPPARTAFLAAVVLLSGCSDEPRKAPVAQKPAPPAPAKIVNFYSSPNTVASGESVTLCYGVENATSVTLTPAVADVGPSPNRCVQFSPKRTATYTLTATGTTGSPATQSLTVPVSGVATSKEAAGPGGMIDTFAASAPEVAAGQPVTICYSVHGATSKRIEPAVEELTQADRGCTTARPSKTTTYTLSVSGGGAQERRRLTVRVR
ncbi:MAG TPA: hypothetical protein VF767_12455 [Bryobacteraceae bacterium]